ncbi:DUF3341 domain-containing protein [Azospirillum rugosum]|uniref:Quinol:cytochrome c oxidoreductase membrane protein n=1 Tax=Azospirillum rugosum TaxID=416170 RepID=A0ABS4SJ86_9PROT|nr:DUF3341 domain-containing protein [Azospirillum rugosum]MBP2292626.1 hypothetical protein [Azospirillum rugosum]MDQ0526350.1 hypothetical protein [Azospirillum rugosum]
MSRVLVVFDSPDRMLDALRRLREAGFARLEVYSPQAVEGVDELLGRRSRALPLVIIAAGVAGAVGGFLLQYIGMAVHYPLNIGGRPLNSWPAFSTSTFELAALAMLLVGTLAFFALCRLPRLYDPVFEVPGMERATQDRFLIGVDLREASIDRERLERVLARFDGVRIEEVPE